MDLINFDPVAMLTHKDSRQYNYFLKNENGRDSVMYGKRRKASNRQLGCCRSTARQLRTSILKLNLL